MTDDNLSAESADDRDLDALTLDALDLVARADAASLPTEVLSDARGVFTWLTIDAELALLTFDSANDLELAGVRGTAGAVRSLAFEVGDIGIEFDCEADGDTIRIDGVVAPYQPLSVTIQHASGQSIEATVADHGVFVATGVASGAARLRICFEPEQHTEILTEWVSIGR